MEFELLKHDILKKNKLLRCNFQDLGSAFSGNLGVFWQNNPYYDTGQVTVALISDSAMSNRQPLPFPSFTHLHRYTRKRSVADVANC